ncbi:molybdopterin adenylyltransferase [Ignatzschineria rhizosphaerae]|uniref:Molybdopterin adenylyltransferase n=1 Tax=Ignatzschineria rhizosphaerae TaxID=2923279 RepID=A0ABY3X5Z5_9GAMM|nr:molybdopterin adenylyltransferase [Ignatzschineria rhizosphaerae]UNM96166.1 molybdopterin adenylyltransferase [Ignatzschineria rhizosphaerae]
MRDIMQTITIGVVSVSDRASQGIYEDEGIPHLKAWLTSAIQNPIIFHERLIADEQAEIEATLTALVDHEACDLILTTGGTGPTKRDVTPDATLAIADKEMPGFGEQMRQVSLYFVPTAILSRQVAVIRNETLIVNLPGRPRAIEETLAGVKDSEGKVVVNGIFSAIPYCLDLIGAAYIEVNESIATAFRPKKK